MMTIADLRCLFDILRCLPSSSTRKANSYFEEEIASMFREEKSVEHKFLRIHVGSINFFAATFQGNIST